MKKRLNFPDQINVLCSAGTRDNLVAIAFYRGQKGVYAEPTKDFIAEGISQFVSGLSPKERAAFDEILSTVQTSEAYRKQIRGAVISGRQDRGSHGS